MKHPIQLLKRFPFAGLVCGLSLVATACLPLHAVAAVVPPAEKLLPADTLVLLTTPDYSHLKGVLTNAPQNRLWEDPAMKPFKDKFMTRCQTDLIDPLQHELQINFDNYTSLLQGQVTFALTQNGWQGDDNASPGLLFLVDTKSKSPQLKKDLAELRKKWVDAGKQLRTEKIRNIEFVVLSVSSNEIPKTLRNLAPKPSKAPASTEDDSSSSTTNKQADLKLDLFLGQADTLFIAANSSKAAESVLVRLAGSSAPVLGEQPVYQTSYQSLFRNSPFYGWVNTKTFIDMFLRKLAEAHENSSPENPMASLQPDRIFTALGITGLRSAAFSFQPSSDGAMCQFFLGVPEANRQGIFKILAGEAKETTPPPFVPATAVKFQRWRIDGQKTWATLEQVCSDISPQWLSSLNFLLDSASATAREKDPGFDVRKNLIGNLGDDLITYEKAPQGSTLADLQSAPSLALVSSPNPEQLVATVKSLFGFFTQQSGGPSEREFLGHKIVSVSLPNTPFSGAGSARSGQPKNISFVASAGYVAVSTDAAILEEYLRSSDSQAKTLRETAGLTEASQKVLGPGTSLFGYENQVETLRPVVEFLRTCGTNSSSSAVAQLNPIASVMSMPIGTSKLSDWVDFSLLPSYDKMSKYFSFAVYAGSANADGLTLKTYSPVPPLLKGTQGAASTR